MAFLLKRLRENDVKVLLAQIGVRPRETSATVGNSVSYATGLLRPFFRVTPVIKVESRMVAWGLRPAPRFPSPLIKRACRFPALGFPIGFTTRPTMVGLFMLVSSDDTPARDVSSPCDMSFH